MPMILDAQETSVNLTPKKPMRLSELAHRIGSQLKGLQAADLPREYHLFSMYPNGVATIQSKVLTEQETKAYLSTLTALVYWRPAAWVLGGSICVKYNHYQEHVVLTREEAEAYLSALKGGYTGKFISA